MTSVYATRDSDGSRIMLNADIHVFASETEAKDWLLKPYNPAEWNIDSAVIESGEFSDCWIKAYSKIENVDISPFKLKDLIVSEPGSHPGGSATWITPRSPVLVVSQIRDNDED